MMLFDNLDDDNDNSWDDDEDAFIDVPDDELPTKQTIPPPRLTETLVGHQAIEQELLSMFHHGRFPHGLIFSGMEGIGKSVMAFRLARFLLARGNDNAPDDTLSMFGDAPPPPAPSLSIPASDPVFAQVGSGGHPDLRVIGRTYDEKNNSFKNSVAIDSIRTIAPFMRQTASNTAGWRVVILDDADLMTTDAQNSLLKILEEPPEKSVLILVAHRAGALLPTLYSRCVHIPFTPLPDDVVRAEITGRCPADKVPFIVAMAEGSLGAAYEYANDIYADIITSAMAVFEEGAQKGGGLNWTRIQLLADALGAKGNDDGQRIFRETLLWFASALVREKITQGFDVYRSYPLARRLKIYDELRHHFDMCRMGSLDKKFMVMGAYMAFEGDKPR